MTLTMTLTQTDYLRLVIEPEQAQSLAGSEGLRQTLPTIFQKDTVTRAGFRC